MTLNNGKRLPLVGLGVGNLQHELIHDVVEEAVGGLGVRFIDTAMASNNERLVVDALPTGGAGVVGVQTKVWYTNLGYERTVRAVLQSLHDIYDSRHHSHHPRLPIAAAVLNSHPDGLFDPIVPYGDAEADDHAGAGGGQPQINVTVLLHWPRCNDDIPWMHCEAEEQAVPDHVKRLDGGVPPHARRDQDEAWQESWRALEDLYGDGSGPIANIGVSNFDAREMILLLQRHPSEEAGEERAVSGEDGSVSGWQGSRVVPQLVQGNLWSALYNPDLMRVLQSGGGDDGSDGSDGSEGGSGGGGAKVVFQAYNVMNGVIANAERAPLAALLLSEIARDIAKPDRRFHGGSGDASEDSAGEEPPAPSSVLLKWLTSEGVAVIPRASSAAHLALNSPAAIAAVPDLSRRQALLVADAARALLRGDDRLLPSDLQESLRRRHEEANQREQREQQNQQSAPAAEERIVATFVNRLAPKKKKKKQPEGDGKEGDGEVAGGDGDGDDGGGKDGGHAQVFWIHSETGDEVPATGVLKPGETASLHTRRGHKFIARHVVPANEDSEDSGADGKKEGKKSSVVAGTGLFEVTTTGSSQHFHIQAEEL